MSVESINEVSIIPPFHPYCPRAASPLLVRALPGAGIVRVITKLSGRQAPVLNSLSYHPVLKNQDQGSGSRLVLSAKHHEFPAILLRIKNMDQGSEISFYGEQVILVKSVSGS